MLTLSNYVFYLKGTRVVIARLDLRWINTVTSSAGATTPAASVHGSDSEEDEVDDEKELAELRISHD